MSSLERINRTAEFYSSQELWAALLCQVRFNEFSGTEIVKDLYFHSQLWSSFVFTRPIYTSDPTGLGIRNQIDLLLDMAQSNSSDRAQLCSRYPISFSRREHPSSLNAFISGAKMADGLSGSI